MPYENLPPLLGDEMRMLRILTEWGTNIDTPTFDADYLPYFNPPFDRPPSGFWQSRTSDTMYVCTSWSDLLYQLHRVLEPEITRVEYTTMTQDEEGFLEALRELFEDENEDDEPPDDDDNYNNNNTIFRS